jgi:prevent-host-death family protein
MQIISAPEADRAFNQVIDQAQHEPIMIRQQNRNVAVILSIEEYQRIIQTNIQEFQQFRANIGYKAETQGLSEEKLQELLNSD